ncbi:hypothetical protein EJ05DRAFT_473812 [Pseudovirgaria hyperparasitica]|uniref:CSN8/PSMD8/EIF3K domain-containing protein n=1 Tax=Pseudovirgaria hyperparasitica TaxID=470096 RepID=A0A6A6WEY4_9PEZI|nr:uncharacterized protein EJ05DRAFT_473812 [Pseudovirgaria hyperparasitica]KAF2761283.1 hypothetical protein EJ05DRAFT_473812 [Pseudovirgaria hyperparasitica]
MAAQQRPSGRRGPPSGGGSRWREFSQLNRLKPVVTDPLEEYGLPSKGETRLHTFNKQEEFYKTIVTRYMQLCAESGGGDELTNLFAAISLVPVEDTGESESSGISACSSSSSVTSSRPVSAHSNTTTFSMSSRQEPQGKRTLTVELNMILSAMRKLREAIVASHRVDNFAQRAYIFIIHASILVQSFESYHPALLYLLKHIHPRSPLSEPELHEFAGYYILDQACRLSDITAAHATRIEYQYRDRRVEGVLRALTTDNWVRFWKLRRAIDGYQAKLLAPAEDRMRLHVLKCFGRSYISVEKPFVERSVEATWDELVGQGVGWQLDESTNKVVIRRPKAK